VGAAHARAQTIAAAAEVVRYLFRLMRRKVPLFTIL
jgi:hypothetical protein